MRSSSNIQSWHSPDEYNKDADCFSQTSNSSNYKTNINNNKQHINKRHLKHYPNSGYRCQLCKRLPIGKSYQLVVETRPTTYNNNSNKTTRGSEIVKELRVCRRCYDNYKCLMLI